MEEALSIIKPNGETNKNYINNLHEKDCNRFIFVILYRLLHEKMDQYSCVQLLIMFHQRHIQFIRIPKINKLLHQLYKNGNQNCCRLIALNIKYFRSRDMLLQLLNKLRIDETHRVPNDNEMSDDWTRDLTICLIDLRIKMKAFNDPQFVLDLQCPKLPPSVPISDWIHIHQTELHERLRCMVLLFGINFLKQFDVKIVTFAEYQEMDFNEKILYYYECCQKLLDTCNDGMCELARFAFLGKCIKRLINQLTDNKESEIETYDNFNNKTDTDDYDQLSSMIKNYLTVDDNNDDICISQRDNDRSITEFINNDDICISQRDNDHSITEFINNDDEDICISQRDDDHSITEFINNDDICISQQDNDHSITEVINNSIIEDSKVDQIEQIREIAHQILDIMIHDVVTRLQKN